MPELPPVSASWFAPGPTLTFSRVTDAGWAAQLLRRDSRVGRAKQTLLSGRIVIVPNRAGSGPDRVEHTRSASSRGRGRITCWPNPYRTWEGESPCPVFSAHIAKQPGKCPAACVLIELFFLVLRAPWSAPSRWAIGSEGPSGPDPRYPDRSPHPCRRSRARVRSGCRARFVPGPPP